MQHKTDWEEQTLSIMINLTALLHVHSESLLKKHSYCTGFTSKLALGIGGGGLHEGQK